MSSHTFRRLASFQKSVSKDGACDIGSLSILFAWRTISSPHEQYAQRCERWQVRNLPREAAMPKDSDGFVRAIARGFAVVEALGRPPGRHTLSEVAVIAEINRATARRVLATLVTQKYCEADGRY